MHIFALIKICNNAFTNRSKLHNMDLPISKDLSVGEILRTKADSWMSMGDTAAFSTELLKGNKLLLTAETGFAGMVGESITCYSYAVLNLVTLDTVVITSYGEFKKLVYPYQFKKARIASWAAMKNGELFGWSEDPRSYVQ